MAPPPKEKEEKESRKRKKKKAREEDTKRNAGAIDKFLRDNIGKLQAGTSEKDGGTGFATVKGFNTWWKLNPRVAEHENSSVHTECFVKWKELELRTQQCKTIDKAALEVIKIEEKKWRDYLKMILDIIRYLAKQNLALRGHREDEESKNKGNFLEHVLLMAKYSPVLHESVLKLNSSGSNQTSYLSPRIQNEFIQLIGDRVRQKIISQIKDAKYYSIIFDSTPALSHVDQTSQVLRYVVVEEGLDSYVQESFIDFIETKENSAEDITTLIHLKLESDGLNIMDWRGQGYDNASVT